MQKGIQVSREIEFDAIWKVLTAFADTFPNSFYEEKKREEYTVKIMENGFFIAAFLDDEPVGFISGYANDTVSKRAYISFLAISQSVGFHRGRVLMKMGKMVLDYVNSCGMNTLWAEVYDDNFHARRIYEKLGMNKVGRASDHSDFMMIDLSKLDWYRDEIKL